MWFCSRFALRWRVALRVAVIGVLWSVVVHAQAQSALLRGTGEPTCVFLDGLMSSARDAARTTGPETMAHSGLIVDGMRCEHALVTTVDTASASDETATLAIRLNRVYGRFRAQACREDRAAEGGAAPVRFEVWGDDALLWHSDPLRPTERATGGASAATIDVSVRAVTTLRLVVRYAATDHQGTKRPIFARGCVWATARLLPLADDRVIAAPGRSGNTDTDDVAMTLLRSALRTATVRLAALAMKASEAAETPLRLPLRVYVGPIAGVTPVIAERLQALLVEMLGQAVGGEDNTPIFFVVGDSGENRRSRGRRRPPPEADVSVESQRATAREAGADWLVAMTLQPQAADTSAAGSVGSDGGVLPNAPLNLQILAARGDTAVVLTSILVPLPPDTRRR
jgi:hypothetical protein